MFHRWSDECGLLKPMLKTCSKHAVTLRDVYGPSRTPSIVVARWEVWSWLQTSKKKSSSEIGRAFGRCHTTVLHGVKKFRAGIL